jgi:hypothetical protein
MFFPLSISWFVSCWEWFKVVYSKAKIAFMESASIDMFAEFLQMAAKTEKFFAVRNKFLWAVTILVGRNKSRSDAVTA